MIVLGVGLIAISLLLFKMGFGSLKDKRNHLEYGVESQGAHTAFSWVFIVAASVCAFGGGLLVSG